MNNPQPDLVIFRIPDEDNRITFVQVPIDEKGNMNAAEVWTFHVLPEDSYNDLLFNELILAQAHEDGSVDLARFVMREDQTVHEFLQTMDGAITLVMMVDEYMTTPNSVH